MSTHNVMSAQMCTTVQMTVIGRAS